MDALHSSCGMPLGHVSGAASASGESLFPPGGQAQMPSSPVAARPAAQHAITFSAASHQATIGLLHLGEPASGSCSSHLCRSGGSLSTGGVATGRALTGSAVDVGPGALGPRDRTTLHAAIPATPSASAS